MIGAIVLSEISMAQVSLTREEALKAAFPESARVERKTLFLTDDQVERIQTMARAKVESKIVTYYTGKFDTRTIGYAFFETHIVRTMPETFMAVINSDGTLKTVEILAFYEPEDYRPPARWLNQFKNRTLSDDLLVKRGIRNVSGATLSAHAITEGIRRALAVYHVALRKEESK